MADETLKKCKSKGCNNPVIAGKYCEYHNQNKKERRNWILGGAGSALLAGGAYAIKKGALKQIPKIAAKVIKVILKR